MCWFSQQVHPDQYQALFGILSASLRVNKLVNKENGILSPSHIRTGELESQTF